MLVLSSPLLKKVTRGEKVQRGLTRAARFPSRAVAETQTSDHNCSHKTLGCWGHWVTGGPLHRGRLPSPPL